MTSSTITRAAQMLAAFATAAVIVSCGNPPQFAQNAATDSLGRQASAQAVSSTPAEMTPERSLAPVTGNSMSAAQGTAGNFAIGFSEFSPFDFEPAAEWFDRWSRYAAPALIGRIQITINDWWAWSWQTQTKAFDAAVTASTVTSDTGDMTVVSVTVSRWLLGINDTGDKATRQSVVYRIAVDRNATPPQVVTVDRVER